MSPGDPGVSSMASSSAASSTPSLLSTSIRRTVAAFCVAESRRSTPAPGSASLVSGEKSNPALSAPPVSVTATGAVLAE